MAPSQLPPGDYELTLRSTQPDGKQATSQQSVAVSAQPSLKDQLDVAPVTPDRASVVAIGTYGAFSHLPPIESPKAIGRTALVRITKTSTSL